VTRDFLKVKMKFKGLLHKVKKIDYKGVIAAVFLVCVFYIGAATFPLTVVNVGNIFNPSPHIRSVVGQWIDLSYREMLNFDTIGLQNKGFYINLQGLTASLLGQRHLNDMIKLYNGHITEEAERKDTTVAAAQISKVCDRQKEKGKDFLFVMAPFQVPKFEDIMPPGFRNYSNENADDLLALLGEAGVPTLDLRDKMIADGKNHSDAFFVTDHHWRPETGLWAFTKIIDDLVQTGKIEPALSPATDINEYNVEVLEDFFLGSFGRRTGIFFAGVDDFSVITPKFETDFSVTTPYSGEIDKRGSFEEVIINESRLVREFFVANPYPAYGYANKGLVQYRNENAPIDLKVLATGDSFSHVSYIYLPLIFSTCDQLDLRYLEGSFEKYYEEFDPDIVIMLINPSQVMLENATHAFFK